MSLTSSLYIGMSGMRTNEGAIGVIGNNIANLNTIGFKASRAVFADLLSANMLGTAGMSQAGQGAALAAVQRMVQQGAILGTNVTTDLAVNGDGYFLVNNPTTGERFFSRNGQFQIDDAGFMTTVDGMRLQGFPADSAGAISATAGDLQVQNATTPGRATTAITMTLNLDANTATGDTWQTQVTVFDSLGNQHQLDVTFTHEADGSWSWNATSPQGEIDGSADTTPQPVGNGTLTFDSDGNLIDDTQANGAVTYFNASPQNLAFDFGDPANPGTASTANAGISAVSFVEQDGFAPGALAFIEIDPDGTIKGTFSNGQERALGQVALARFQAPGELNAIGQNLFTETLASGEPAIGAPGSGGRGNLMSGSLEQSTVDLTNEFTQLILAQRGFQASSRTITTADQMLAETVNLKQ